MVVGQARLWAGGGGYAQATRPCDAEAQVASKGVYQQAEQRRGPVQGSWGGGDSQMRPCPERPARVRMRVGKGRRKVATSGVGGGVRACPVVLF